MTGVDATMSSYFQPFLVPLAALFISLRIVYFLIRKIYPSIYVFAWRRISLLHHKIIRKHKDMLFSSVADLREENQRFFALEIGCGPGHNFDIFPPNTSLVVVEPNGNFQADVAKNAQKHPNVEAVKFIEAGAEDLREYVKDASQDVVVSTFTLCSVRDLKAVVREVRRVLKPGGRFYFIEHTKAHSRNSWAHLLQYLLAPLVYLMWGCMIRQTPWVTVDRAGFSKVHYTKMDFPDQSLVFRPHVLGYAEN